MSRLHFKFYRVLAGYENGTMQTEGYGPGDIGYQDTAWKGNEDLVWINGNGWDIDEKDLEPIALDDIPQDQTRKWHTFLIYKGRGWTKKDIEPFIDIYQEVMPFKDDMRTFYNFHDVARKFSDSQIRRMAEVIIGEEIAHPIVLLGKGGEILESKIKGEPKTVWHSRPAWSPVANIPPEVDISSFYKLTELSDSRGNPIYLELWNDR